MTNKSKKIQDHLNFFNYALRSVFTYKTRTAAIIGALVIALMVLGSTVFVSDGLLKEAQLSVKYAPDITVQNMNGGRVVPFGNIYGERISEFIGVDRITPRVWGYILLHDKIYTLMGIDASQTPSLAEMGITVGQGRLFSPGEKNVAVIGALAAETLGVKLNDKVQIAEVHAVYTFEVVGIFDSDVSLFTSDMILIDMETSRDFLDIPAETVTDLCVYVENKAQIPATANYISEIFPDLRVITRDAMNDAVVSTYGTRSGFVSILWFIALVAVVLVAWNQASSASRDSQREVGVLKALGFSTSNILEIRFLETIILGFIGTSIAIFSAIIFDVYLGAPVIRNFMLGYTAIYPSYPIPVYISFSSLLTLYAAAFVPLMLGTLIPAWKSAITEPDIVMRGS